MIFGNKEVFAIEIRPLAPNWERRYAPEKSAWATLLTWISGTNLCRHSQSGSDQVVEGLNVPLAPIADWLVKSWHALAYEERAALFPTSDQLHEDLDRWGDRPAPGSLSDEEWIEAREDWWSRHFIAAGAEGAYLPFLALARQDEKLIFDWSTPGELDAPDFLSKAGNVRVDWQHAESAMAGFVGFVADWLRTDGLGDLYDWVHDDDPLRDRPTSLVTAIELYTGRSILELQLLTGATTDSAVVDKLGLPSDAPDPGASLFTQVLRDLPPRLPDNASDVLRLLDQAVDSGENGEALVRLRELTFDAQRAAQSDEHAGYLAAEAVRGDLGLNGKPVDDLDAVLRFLGIQPIDSDVSGHGTRMVAGARRTRGAAAIVLEAPNTQFSWGRRFELGRALGHILLDEMRGGVLGAASSAFSQHRRRRRSGAFAAEFLLPVTGLRQVTNAILDRAADPNVFEELLERFGVGARTAAQHLWNRHLLSSTEVRDELIDQYSSPQTGAL